MKMKTFLNILMLCLLPMFLSAQTSTSNPMPDLVEVNVPPTKDHSKALTLEELEAFWMEHGEGFEYIIENKKHIRIYIYECNVLIIKPNGRIVYNFDQYIQSKRYYTAQDVVENGIPIPDEFVIDFIFVKDEFIKVYMGDVLLMEITELQRVK